MTLLDPTHDIVARPAAFAAKAALKRGASLEATPRQVATGGALLDQLPPGTDIYLPWLPGADMEETFAAATAVTAKGLRATPHLPARAIASGDELDDTLARYRAIGLDGVLLIAGDVATPKGGFADTLDLLETGLLERHGVRRISVAGHPDGHPKADQATLDRALLTKAAYARATGADMRVVTQFVFDAASVIAWERRLRAIGVDLPVRVGLAGPAKMRAVLSYAFQCGVGASAKMLMKRPSAARALGRWSPEGLVDELSADRAAAPGGLIEGVHVFPFGGLRAARAWLTGVD